MMYMILMHKTMNDILSQHGLISCIYRNKRPRHKCKKMRQSSRQIFNCAISSGAIKFFPGQMPHFLVRNTSHNPTSISLSEAL